MIYWCQERFTFRDGRMFYCIAFHWIAPQISLALTYAKCKSLTAHHGAWEHFDGLQFLVDIFHSLVWKCVFHLMKWNLEERKLTIEGILEILRKQQKFYKMERYAHITSTWLWGINLQTRLSIFFIHLHNTQNIKHVHNTISQSLCSLPWSGGT